MFVELLRNEARLCKSSSQGGLELVSPPLLLFSLTASLDRPPPCFWLPPMLLTCHEGGTNAFETTYENAGYTAKKWPFKTRFGLRERNNAVLYTHTEAFHGDKKGERFAII